MAFPSRLSRTELFAKGEELRSRFPRGSHGVWKPPADFKDELLWKGEITCSPLEFEVRQK